MIKNLAITAPFFTCLFWTLSFLFHYLKHNSSQRFLTIFFATGSLLYFSHFYYFSGGTSQLLDVLWSICSLCVYPLFYEYLYRLTKGKHSNLFVICILLPGIIVGLSKLFIPFFIADVTRIILNTLQMCIVCYFGIKMLKTYSKEINEIYADTDDKEATPVQVLLMAFVLSSLASGAAIVLGRQYCFKNELLILIFSGIFTVLLFLIGFFGFTQSFSYEQLQKDTPNDSSIVEQEVLGDKLEELMTMQKMYLTHNLKINDVALALGTCRTYLSQYINHNYGCSFSDYINKLRIEYAKQLLSEGKFNKLSIVAAEAGFSTEQSFYGNFRKYVHKSPSQWVKQSKS